MIPTTHRSNHVKKVGFPKPMAGTVSSANGANSEDASVEDIGRLINPHMTARREVAATPNVTAADDAMPIVTSDKTLAEAQAGGADACWTSGRRRAKWQCQNRSGKEVERTA